MAHHPAGVVYRMLKFGAAYVDKGIEHYEAKYRLHQIIVPMISRVRGHLQVNLDHAF